MLFSICKVHLHVQAIFDLIHHPVIFFITVYFTDNKSVIAVVPEDLIKCMLLVFVMLPGMNWYQTSELDGPPDGYS